MATRSLEAAQAHQVAGRLEEAETLYRESLLERPDDPGALQGLGVLAYQRGDLDEAAVLLARALESGLGTAPVHANLGEVFRMLGRLDEAARHLEAALALDPGLPDAWNSIGLLARAEDRPGDAEEAFREAARLRPGFAAALVNLGTALRARRSPAEAAESFRAALQVQPDSLPALLGLGWALSQREVVDSLDEAEVLLRKARDLFPHLPGPHNDLGNVLQLQQRADEARECFQEAARLGPDRPVPRENLGRLLQQLGRLDEAECAFREAHAIRPDAGKLHAHLGSLAQNRQRYDQAAEFYRRSLEAAPGSAEAQHGLGLALLCLGRLDEAELAFLEALRLDPAQVASWISLARVQAERGDLNESCQSARAALAIRPNLPEAYGRLAATLKARMPLEELRAMEALRDARYLPDAVRASLAFDLATVYDAQGRPDEAALLLEEANARQTSARSAGGQVYDPDAFSRFVDRLIATFTPEFLAARRGWTGTDPMPVFIVGLPRSGSTLTEQVLASHPGVVGAGELRDIFRTFETLPLLVGTPSSDPFGALEALGPSTARSIARRHLDRLASLAPPGAVRVVDKMPDNVYLLGLIAALWPGARVIHCRRDPLDVAVSCWQTEFEAILWANRPDHIARRFADHRRIVEHWTRTCPLDSVEVRYEDLVADLEGQARLLIDFLGLEWDPRCLEFHATRRAVRTASLVEVRQPLYTRAIGRWRRYETALSPLFEAIRRLNPVEDDRNGRRAP